MNKSTSKQVGNNPKGIGGFGDNPRNISRDGRTKNDQRFGYWLQFFKNLTFDEFGNYSKKRPVKEMFVAEVIAYERVKNSRKDLPEYKEVADRTEGKSVWRVEAEVKTEITKTEEGILNELRQLQGTKTEDGAGENPEQ